MLDEALGLLHEDKFSEAAERYRAVIQTNPGIAVAWSNLGMALRKLGHTEAALGCAQRALDLDPGNPGYLTNLGNVLTDLDRKNEALEAHAKAYQASPNDFLIRKNYAGSLREFAHFEQALFHYDAACAMQPDNDSVKFDRATTYLHLGRFKEGWATFYTRWKMPEAKMRPIEATPWQGQKLEGKTILVHGEQGFGDTVLCSRYMPMVKARGGRVILECKKPLHKLFSTIPGIDRIGEYGEIDERFDYQVPIMSLPGVFRTDLKTIPPVPKLLVPEKPPAQARKLLELAGDKFKVGIVWSGSVTFKGNKKRAVGVERFVPLASIPGVQLYSLQKGPCEKELYDAGADALIWDLSADLNDFTDTAAILNKLDLVIMTDSSVAHIAGSIGCPVWNLLNYRPYWLYLSYRDDCPWYPSMRLIRQTEPGNWDTVFAKVAVELEKAVTMKAAGQWNKPHRRMDKVSKAA